MKITFLPSFVFFLLLNLSLHSQTMRGVVRDADSKTLLSGANLEFFSNKEQKIVAQIETDSSGKFLVTKLAPNSYYRLTISYLGYQTAVFSALEVVGGKDLVLDIPLSTKSLLLAETQIRPDSKVSTLTQNQANSITLTRDEVDRYPTMFFDPARLAAASAGVVQNDDGSNGLSIRGNSTANVGWRLEGAEIVNPNHLSNAGTFGDFSAAASGGVLMFSSQMMGNSTLLKGNYPVGFGNALGGVMDMTLRNGNENQREKTIQIGLTGVDLALEGPLGKKKRMSFSTNVRYSTVGILGNLGVSFGGEKIQFGDAAYKLNYRRKNGYTSFFGVLGLSENVYKFEGTPQEIKYEKNQHSIYYRNNTIIFGLTHFWQINTKNWFKATSIGSFNTSSWGKGRSDVEFWLAPYSNMDNTDAMLSLNVQVGNIINDENLLKWGVNMNRFNNELYSYSTIQVNNTFFGTLTYSNSTGLNSQPFVALETQKGRIKNVIGFQLNHLSVYGGGLDYNSPNSKKTNIEPRWALDYLVNRKQKLSFNASLVSQRLPNWLTGYESTDSRFKFLNLDLQRAAHLNLEYQYQINDKWSAKAGLFFQYIYKVPVNAATKDAFNFLNVNEIAQFDSLKSTGKGQNYGLEITLTRQLQRGWFLNTNATIFKSQTQGSDEVWRNSRWDANYLANVIFGKEWRKEKRKERFRTLGVSTRLVATGGQRLQTIDYANSVLQEKTVFDATQEYRQDFVDYSRLDARFYWKRSIADRRNMTFAFEIQNLLNKQNLAFYYFDNFTKKVEPKYQLGLIPNISWRLEF
jgi:Carboxypeptidase regulatory-like domain